MNKEKARQNANSTCVVDEDTIAELDQREEELFREAELEEANMDFINVKWYVE